MKCRHCGADLGDGAGRSRARCERCGKDPRTLSAGSGGRSDFRPVTSLVDRPADPAMIDETPPPSGAGTAPGLEQGESEQEEAGRRSMAGAEIEEGAPVTPADVRAPLDENLSPSGAAVMPSSDRRTPPGVADMPDFGEARQIPDAGAPLPSPPPERVPEEKPSPEEPSLRNQWRTAAESTRRERPGLAPKGGFWIRLVALLIDTLFLSLLSWVVFTLIFTVTGLQEVIVANSDAIRADPYGTLETLRPFFEPYEGVFAIATATLYLVGFLYRPLCHATWGRTLGKWILGLRVVTTEGAPLSIGKSFVRYIGYTISLIPFGLGLLWVVYDPQKQGWHDKMASTYVIKERG